MATRKKTTKKSATKKRAASKKKASTKKVFFIWEAEVKGEADGICEAVTTAEARKQAKESLKKQGLKAVGSIKITKKS